MALEKKYDSNRLREYSSLFSRNEVNRWVKSDLSNLQLKIKRYDPQVLAKKNYTYITYLKHIYSVMEKYYPNEYVYKNEFITKWLIKEVGLADSKLFNEFRLGKAVADLAIFNGNSKVFEIKTLLDKETRLNSQIFQYERLFNQIYLVVPEEKSSFYLKRDCSTGIIIYDNANGAFSLIRQAQFNYDIDINILMQVLHTEEYITIVRQYFGDIPEFNDFNKFQICKELIEQIPQDSLSHLFVERMKARRIYNSFSKQERQFNQLFLSMNYSDIQKRQLLSNLSTTIN